MIFLDKKSYLPLQMMIRDIFLKNIERNEENLKKFFTFDKH